MSDSNTKAQHPPHTRRLRSHWADTLATQLAQHHKDRPHAQPIICAAGISPSGVVHSGNFRELITVDLVCRGLHHMGIENRFLFFWDDYDALRKLPDPTANTMQPYLRMPLAKVPPLHNPNVESYARENELAVEKLLPLLGIRPHYIYQHTRYTNAHYADQIAQALNKRDTIRTILNRHRQQPLPTQWWPISIFSSTTGRDTTTILDWDGTRYIHYRCDESGHEEHIDIYQNGSAKLQWRVDWPARWAKEKVDFEPAGKDHHAPGGSFDTAREIAQEVYGVPPPLSTRYDFIGIKGMGGKMSSSGGTTVSIGQLLEIYQPSVIRYLFAATRPQVEFAISFDGDVIKIYEDYDRCERIYFGLETVGEERHAKERRIYELSQVEKVPSHIPPQIPFRHLCNLIQIYGVDHALSSLSIYTAATTHEQQLLQQRAQCAAQWLEHYAPQQFCFSLAAPPRHLPSFLAEEPRIKEALHMLYLEIADHFPTDEAQAVQLLQDMLYHIARQQQVEPVTFFRTLYQILIEKTQGPRLAQFLYLIGQERVLKQLAIFKDTTKPTQ